MFSKTLHTDPFPEVSNFRVNGQRCHEVASHFSSDAIVAPPVNQVRSATNAANDSTVCCAVQSLRRHSNDKSSSVKRAEANDASTLSSMRNVPPSPMGWRRGSFRSEYLDLDVHLGRTSELAAPQNPLKVPNPYKGRQDLLGPDAARGGHSTGLETSRQRTTPAEKASSYIRARQCA